MSVKDSFVDWGSWKLDGDSIRYKMSENLPDIWNLSFILMKHNLQSKKEIGVVYAFKIGTGIMYIGETGETLEDRMSGHARGGKGSKKGLIKQALKEGKKVAITVLVNEKESPREMQDNEREREEKRLIKKHNPPWNEQHTN